MAGSRTIHLSGCKKELPALLQGLGFMGLCLAALFLLLSPAEAMTTLRVFADPPRIRADGRATAIIIAQVQHETGLPVADGTPVSFSTSLGAISPMAETRGGVARAVLTSGASVGTAMVSALVAEVRQEIEVEFFAEGGETQGGAAIIQLQGKEVVYNRQSGLATVREEGRFSYGAISLRARAMQCNIAGANLSAQVNVEISDGKQSICGDAVVFNARSGRGSLLRYEGEAAKIYTFTTPGLETTLDEKGDIALFRPAPETASRTLITCKQLLVRPDGQIIFSDAAILADGQKLVSFPHYVMNTGGREFLERAINFSNNVGLTAEFPYYLAAKPGSISLLRFTHNLTPEGAPLRRGFNLNLEEQYMVGEKGQGTLNLDDLAGDTRGVRWVHSQEFGPGIRSFTTFRYTRFDPNSSRSLEAATTLSKALPKLALDLSLRANSYGEYLNYAASLAARTPGRRIGASKFTYSVGLRLGYALSRYMDQSYSPETGTIVEGNAALRGAFSEGLSLQLHAPQVKLAQKTTLDSGLTLLNNWAAGRVVQSLNAIASLRRAFGRNGNLGINYNALITRNSANSTPLYHRQGFSCNMNVSNPGIWESFGFASYDVENRGVFASGTLNYHLPFQKNEADNRPWTLSLAGLAYKWDTSLTTDMRASLARGIGNWEVSLNYSPHGSEFGSGLISGAGGLMGLTGYGYTQNLGRTFWIEISPQSLF